MSDTNSKSRSQLRADTVELVNNLSKAELLEHFNISRVSDLTGMDCIGVPVYSVVRALSKTISIHSGKGLEPGQVRAGAILEAIELDTAERPQGKFIVLPAAQIPDEDRLDLSDCFPVRSGTLSEFTPLAWEEATNIQNGVVKLVPSDLIWMDTRLERQALMYVQMGSNGLASGATLEDAILSALYEVIERDAWTLHQFLLDNCGFMPKRCPLGGLPLRVETLVRKIESANVRLHLFDVSNDYLVPVFGAMLIDLTGNCAGTFGGFGAHLNAEIAAIRAITEAIQSRACYISGARDDLFRRQFLLTKRVDQNKLDQMFNELSLSESLVEYRTLHFETVQQELRYLLKLIKSRGVSDVFVKELGSFLDGRIHVVRVISPQCEPFRFDFHTPGLRCLSYAKRKIKELANT